MENGGGVGSRDQHEDGSSRRRSHHRAHQTPSRRRVNLGAPANYYFKYMNSCSNKSLGDANDSIMRTGDDDTGTISIPGLTPRKGDGGDRQSRLAETSYLSIGDSSSGSETSDLLNKSTLSDTTELTASNFVLVTTSKQQMARTAASARKPSASEDRPTKANQALQTLKDMGVASEKENRSNFSVQLSAEKNPAAVSKGPSNQSGEENRSVSNETIGLRDSSPSLRSRISSSPASLRRYREDLRNSRMKRQMQREQDAKRRNSTDDGTSIPFMHAQLEALTTDTTFSRQRLPPQFLQPSQLSQETNGMYSNPSTPSGSTVAFHSDESTSLVDMNELDALLGIAETTRRDNSSIFAHRSSVDLALGKETTQLDFSSTDLRNEGNTTILSSSKYKNVPGIAVAKSQSLPQAVEVSVDASERRDLNESINLGRAGTQATQLNPSLSSPPPPKYWHTPRSRSKLTPSKLSGGPIRVVDPQSFYSPAKNTQTAKKSTDQGQEEILAYLLPTTNESIRLSLANSFNSSTSEKSDETASLGDIEDLFGKNPSPGGSDSLHATTTTMSSPLEDSGRDASVFKTRKQDVRDYEETASLGDIEELLGTQSSTGRDSLGSDTKPSMQDKNEASESNSTSFPGGEIEGGIDGVTLENGMGASQASKFPTTKSPPVENLASKNELSCMDTPQDKTSSTRDGVASPINDLPSTPPNVDLSTMSPGVKRLLSDSKSARTDRLSLSSKTKNKGSDYREMPTRKPMRLTPNTHVALTPTSLAPTPRRVLNPNNPHSPARNTRSSSKSNQSPHHENKGSASLPRSGEKRPIDVSAKPAQLFQAESVVRSTKRRRSSMVTTPLSHFEEFGRPKGILSSRKKHSSVQRSVAFGSPEAAEYNVGSPSISLTPMPKGRAKALYRLPTGRENENEFLMQEEQEKQGTGSQTMEMESDLQILVDRISVENMNNSPELSPIEKSKSDTAVYDVPRDLSSANTLESTTAISVQARLQQQGEQTVELEGGMEDLLANAASNTSPSDDESRSPFHGHDQEKSFEMTDAESIASIHSRRSEKFTAEFNIPINGQKLDFSAATEDSPSTRDDSDMDVDAGNTIELEGNMLSMLQANGPQDDFIQTTVGSTIDGDGKDDDATDGSVQNENDMDTNDIEASMTDIFAVSHLKPTEGGALDASGTSKSRKDQGGETVELEQNMTDLLAVACDDVGKAASQPTCGDDDTEAFQEDNYKYDGYSDVAFTDLGSRRKSLAKTGFTVHQPDQLTVSVNNVEQQSLVVNEKSVSFCDTAEFIVSFLPNLKSPVQEEKSIALTRDEVSQISRTIFQELQKHMDQLSHGVEDALSHFGKITDEIDTIVLDKWCHFVELVCGEVERNTVPDGTASGTLSSNIDSEPNLYLTWHDKLVIKKEEYLLQPIIKNGQRAVESEWNHWLRTVLHSFQGPLDQLPSSLDEDLSSLESSLERCQVLQNGIAKIGDGKAEKARMKSLTRCKVAVKDLEQEIWDIQSKISGMESDLESIRHEEEQFRMERDLVQETRHLASEIDKFHSEANSSQKAYLSLRGMHMWSLGAMSETEVNVILSGTCAQTSFSSSYQFEASGEVTPKMLSQSIISPPSQQFRYHASVASYLQMCMRHLSKNMGQRLLRDTAEVGRHIQKTAWFVGRLDLTARELHVLQRRYRAKVIRKAGDNFSLQINFETKCASIKIEFPLDPLYPAFPVEVQMDLVSGKIDFGAIQKCLVKQSRPGFGSLSRACDIVESFLTR